jgi:hypothetical protein
MANNYEKPRAVGYNYPTLQTTTEYQRFNNDYFTGADVRLYMGDIWVDEITSISFELEEQVQPIYGYASYTFDKVARGTRIIRGSFSINFKESFYLHGVLNSLQSKLKEQQAGKGSVFDVETFKKGVTVEHLIEQASKGRSFGAVADDLENAFWGKSPDKALQSIVNNQPNDTYFYPEERDPKDPTKTLDTSQENLRDKGFNILITYGPYNEKNGVKVAGSAVTIVGVQLQGVSQVIGGDGNPIQEQYTFIAKDLNGRIN